MKQILLVDNDTVFTRTVSFLLEKENFLVSVAKNGKEAAAALASKSFDLVITDVFMPYSNGFELICIYSGLKIIFKNYTVGLYKLDLNLSNIDR